MSNPLLVPSPLPNQAPPFDAIREEHYMPALEEAIAEARARVDAIVADPAPPDFQNTIVALETASETLGVVTGVFYNQLSANGNDGMHKLAESIGPLSSNFSNDIMHNEALFARVKAVHEAKGRLALTPEQDMLLEETWKGFVRGGALLDMAGKKRFRDISERLSVLSPAYMNNVRKSSESYRLFITDEARLSGLPESALDAARHAAAEKGREDAWLFTLEMPSYGPVLQYADDRALREELWRAYNGQAFGGETDNCAHVLEIAGLRHERARLLGYDTHAHYVLERRMAEKPEAVLSFLSRLLTVYRPAAEKDLADLRAFAAEQGHEGELKQWDVGYYAEKLKHRLFDFSSEDFRPYFRLDRTIEGIFGHFGRLFDVEFRPSAAYPVWHADVRAYELFARKSGDFLGTLYADFHPREGKNHGAWMTSYRNQGLFRGKAERPVIAIVMNFTRPTKDKPSLLTHDEVQTFLHEMGHAMHGLLSRTVYQSLAGTNVLWDFVELPSQIQENWGYRRETLDSFAVHHETGERIPDELIAKLNNARNFMAGWAGLRQVGLARLDMAWHGRDPAGIKDVAAFEDEALAETSLFPRLAGPISTHFGHIFPGGYAAGYYSYKWAEVLDADAFELFEERGLYDRGTADSYRDEILAKGGSEHPRVLYKRFRGRDADPDALLRREGLVAGRAA